MALVALVVLVLALFLVRKDFEPSAKGTLQPVVKRDVFVPVDGDVIDVKVKDRDFVKAGDLLIKLRNTDLEVKYQESSVRFKSNAAAWCPCGGPCSSRRSRSDLRATRRESSEFACRARPRNSNRNSPRWTNKYQLLTKKRELLEIRSPIAGEVMMSWDVQKSLMYRPVRTRSVAAERRRSEGGLGTGVVHAGEPRRPRAPARADKELQARYPGAGERVSYVLATDPGTKRNGKVREVKESTEVREGEGNIVKVKVDIDRSELGDPHPGATVTGQVFCGRKPLGYVWFHEAWEWLQTHVFFYLS